MKMTGGKDDMTPNYGFESLTAESVAPNGKNEFKLDHGWASRFR